MGEETMNEEVLKLYEKWQAIQPLPKEHEQALWQWISLQFNYYSNKFEGNTLSYNESQILLIHGRAVGDRKLRDYEEMKAHNVAFKHMCQLAKEERVLFEGDIRDFNKICLKEPYLSLAQTTEGKATQKEIIPGQYKKQSNYVLTQTGETFYFASPEETPYKMQELTQWIQEWLKKDKEEKHKTLIPFLAELHKSFIHIHPFDDGNGRVVRLLLSYILVRLGFLPMVLNNREEYIKAIQFSDTGDNSVLEKLFLNNIILSLNKGISAKENKIDWK